MTLKTRTFEFDLPRELIAQEPLAERTASRMLVLHRESGDFEDHVVSELPEFLKRGDLMVVNDTKVIPARLYAKWTDTGGALEILLLEELGPREWLAMHRTRRHVTPGLRFRGVHGILSGEVVSRREGGRTVFRFDGEAPVLELLEQEGEPPVPPYISRKENHEGSVAMDRERYQTVYAREAGAVAAPTAGLHFTPDLFAELEKMGVQRAAVTLHVGPGTFKPVTAEEVDQHVMEEERYEVLPAAADAVNRAREEGRRVVAVGSTSVRTLESAVSGDGQVVPGRARSSLFIYPPYSFTIVGAILTNFHLPASTLLMMMSAFVGDVPNTASDPLEGWKRLRKAYEHAIQERYRFYSYGDCMLIV